MDESNGVRSVDTVIGATIRWGGKRLIEIPLRTNGRNLLDGNFVLRIESAKDEGARFRDFKIAIPRDFKGGTFRHRGYVTRATVRVPGDRQDEAKPKR